MPNVDNSLDLRRDTIKDICKAFQFRYSPREVRALFPQLVREETTRRLDAFRDFDADGEIAAMLNEARS